MPSRALMARSTHRQATRSSTTSRVRVLLAGALAALAAMVLPVSVQSGLQPAHPAEDTRPNIVLITADDMTVDELRWMPHTRRLLEDQGVRFTDFLSTHPLCCPARAAILTGQYAQNNGVHHNKGPWGGVRALHSPGNTLPAWLQDSGYATGFFGKYVNGFEKDPSRAPGWTSFDPFSAAVYRAYGFETFNNGDEQFVRSTYTADYVAERTNDAIREFSATDRPFFIWASQIAPHNMRNNGEWDPPIPAERHADLFPRVVAPSTRKASFNEADVQDKPRYVRREQAETKRRMNRLFRQRIRSLQAVDEGVASAVTTLADTGELANTVVVFTSDNGYLLGEHRLTGKNVPYEEALRVPMVMRGPGISADTSVQRLSAIIDLAPTFVDLADAQARRALDGVSLMPLSGERSRSTLLIQAGHDQHEWWWRGVRTGQYTYVKYQTDGFEELYDLATDPLQLENVARDPRYRQVLATLSSELSRLEDCAGDTCS